MQFPKVITGQYTGLCRTFASCRKRKA